MIVGNARLHPPLPRGDAIDFFPNVIISILPWALRCFMLMPFRMKAIAGLFGLSLWVAAACPLICAAADPSATNDQCEVASVEGAQPSPEERNTWAGLQDDCSLLIPDLGLGCDPRAMSTAAMAVDRPRPVPEVPIDSLSYSDSATESLAMRRDKPREDSTVQPAIEKLPVSKPADFNQEIYYRNKLEFSLDGGWHPINIPFPLDVFVGDAYNTYPLKYTLIPIFASLRWHMGNPWGPWILRGNFDLTFTGSVTGVARGPESRYFAYLMGIRRNFIPRNSRVAPYFDVRLGVGNIDAKGPQGVLYAQGQDLTFTINMGSGVRYNFNPRYAISAGLNFMHISNLDLSESNGKPNWGIRNYGINVYGPMVGIDIQLRRHPRRSE